MSEGGLRKAEGRGQQISILAQAVLFDLDGVLVDSTAAAERVWRRWAAKQEIDEQKVMRTMHGRLAVETVRILAPQLDAVAEAKVIEQMEIADTAGVAPLPGAAELLASLGEDEWAVVTSCPRALAEARLAAAGLPRPRRMVTAEMVTRGKPAPDPYAAGVKLFDAQPEYCVAIEDAPIGILSARAAGVRAVALRTTFPEAELIIAHFVVGNCASIAAGRYQGGLQLHLR